MKNCCIPNNRERILILKSKHISLIEKTCQIYSMFGNLYLVISLPKVETWSAAAVSLVSCKHSMRLTTE